MKVYFAGYPLGQDSLTFHKGTISSITEDQGIKRFTIDGTVVPGNSGGPVVIQQDGQIYLVGVITSEIADFRPEDLKTIAIMNALSKDYRSKPQVNSSPGISLSLNGISVSITIMTPSGPENVTVNDREITCLALDLIQRNLSTGIGKAIDIRYYKHLFQKEPRLSQQENSYSYPVVRGKAVVHGGIVEKEGQKRILAKYMEVRYGKGGGNRGIRITLCPSLGEGSVYYIFGPNPHTALGDYNKNQKDLYYKAAYTFVKELISEKQAKDFSFEACKATYNAALEKNEITTISFN